MLLENEWWSCEHYPNYFIVKDSVLFNLYIIVFYAYPRNIPRYGY